jgi:catechol 2,3-dioxygenase-like lactoylglutathione lyase family enzyme
MTLTLDHLVILVPDLDTAIADYRSLGFSVQPGGTHADGGTHNALVVFADGAYLELIAFLRPHPSHRWGSHAARGHSGFVDFALLPPDAALGAGAGVAGVVADAASRGLAYTGPFDGGRLRPDGQRLVWQMGLPPAPELPFLCGDITPRGLRVPEGAVRQHPNGVTGVACITVAVTDLDASLARYAALLGQPGERLPLTGLGLQLGRLRLGASQLLLMATGAGAHGPAAQALHAALGGRQAGVVGLALHGPQAASLSQTHSHGAAIEILAGG